LESTTITTTIVSKSSRAAAVRYEDSMEEEERYDGHEGEDSDNYSDEELVYEPPRNKRPRLDDLENRSASSTTSNGSADDVDDLIVPSEFSTPSSEGVSLKKRSNSDLAFFQQPCRRRKTLALMHLPFAL